MNLSDITPIILSLNESANIGRTLARLNWAKRIVVLDSGSTDDTARIVAGFANAEWHQRDFDTHAQQWNHGVRLATTDWVLTLDADYQLNADFCAEVTTLDEQLACVWYAPFRYLVAGQPVRGAILPPRAVLFRPQDAHYIDDGHTQLLVHPVPAGRLRAAIDHDDRKPLSRWLGSQIRYAELEARKLGAPQTGPLGFADRVRRRVWLAPVLVFLHVYLLRGAIFSGWRGWFYASQRALAELMLSLYLAERKLPRATREQRQ